MYKQLLNTEEMIINGEKFEILTFTVEQPDGMAVEYWYMPKNYGIMRLAYGGMIKDEIKDNPNLYPDYEYITECIDWEALENEC